MTILLGLLQVALAGPGAGCAQLPDEPSLYYTLGVQPSSLAAVTDDELIDTLAADPTDRTGTRMAVVRTAIWSSLAYRVDGNGHIPAGQGVWRIGRVQDPTSGLGFFAVHWQDVDDASFTAWFRGEHLCTIYFEN